MSSKPTKLRILCLHGSRQDGEILSQRLKKLSSKLADIMELHYMDAPHCLPLQKGQMVAMRCWWRHWGLCADEGGTDWDGEGEGEGKGDGKGEGGEMGEGRQRVVDSEVEDLGVEQRRQFREEMLRRREECSWEDVVCGDWAESFKAIQTAWQKGGGFDGILGFSNGAAAAFLSVAHSLGAMNTPLTLPGLQFVIMAGGYRPDPLSSLLSPELVTFTDEGVSCLISPLALPSLHLMGKKDMTTTIEESVGLADNFMASTRVLLEHELSHCVPQKAPHIAAIRDFLGSFVAASQSLPTDVRDRGRKQKGQQQEKKQQEQQHRPNQPKQQQQQQQQTKQPKQQQEQQQQQQQGSKLSQSKQQQQQQPNQPKQQQQEQQEQEQQQQQQQPHRQHGSRASNPTSRVSHPPSAKPTSKTPPHIGSNSSVVAAAMNGLSLGSGPHTVAAPLAPVSKQKYSATGTASATGSATTTASATATGSTSATSTSAAAGASSPHAAVAGPSLSDAYGRATEEQLEEMEALSAIFGDEYRLISSTDPPRFTVYLREPGTASDVDISDDVDEVTRLKMAAGLIQKHDSGGTTGHPSRKFSLTFTLTKSYPQSSPPQVEVNGPLSAIDSRRLELMSLILETAKEAIDSMGVGCVFQIVEVAKEWIDSKLPIDVGSRRDGDDFNPELAGPDPTEPSIPWWENEEADGVLVTEAIAEATATHWGRVHRPLAGAEGDIHGTAEDDIGAGDEESEEGRSSGSSAQRGRWDYVVGMVGKPSAGKSTFYNAIIDPVSEEEAARVAAFPFTTITPNVGRGMFLVPDPAHALGLPLSACNPLHGYAPSFDLSHVTTEYNGVEHLRRWLAQGPWRSPDTSCGDDSTSRILWRKVPVILKDVAGLVPGAYQGRGKGNAFLNDLRDADVLIHVVDVSGSTDKEGQHLRKDEGGDPLEDIGWVKEELHRWVYGNLCSKWSNVLKKPAHLAAMFSGYSCSRGLVYEVLASVGISQSLLEGDGASLSHWGERDLHRLVATFLQIRFPILLALNKADMEASPDNIRRIRSALPHEPTVAVSAASERWLCQQRRAGTVEYKDGGSVATAVPETCDLATSRKVAEIDARVLRQYGGTGALAALTAAIAMRPPLPIFPVLYLETCSAMVAKNLSGSTLLGSGQDAKARLAEGSHPSVMRDCVLMKPGSIVEDAYQVLRKPPYQLLDGEFVRADCRVLTPVAGHDSGIGGKTVRVLKKDEQLSSNTCVLRLLTNRRSSNWQTKY